MSIGNKNENKLSFKTFQIPSLSSHPSTFHTHGGNIQSGHYRRLVNGQVWNLEIWFGFKKIFVTFVNIHVLIYHIYKYSKTA